jgi:hypothetical protein
VHLLTDLSFILLRAPALVIEGGPELLKNIVETMAWGTGRRRTEARLPAVSGRIEHDDEYGMWRKGVSSLASHRA